MKATPSPPGGPIPPAKSMTHAAPRPKVVLVIAIARALLSFLSQDTFAWYEALQEYCLQKSKWYQKLGQSFNAPGITQFGKLTLVSFCSRALGAFLRQAAFIIITCQDMRGLSMEAKFQGKGLDKMLPPYSYSFQAAHLPQCQSFVRIETMHSDSFQGRSRQHQMLMNAGRWISSAPACLGA